MNGTASIIIAPRMPALEANAEVSAPTAHSSSAPNKGTPSPAMAWPTASTVPTRCSTAT
jgi:hypothetical protein